MQRLKSTVSKLDIFQSVGDMTVRYFEEMRRHYYVTPSSYLELLKQYRNLLEKKTHQTTQMRERIQNGLHVSINCVLSPAFIFLFQGVSIS